MADQCSYLLDLLREQRRLRRRQFLHAVGLASASLVGLAAG
jgi:hypothetical protein